LQACRTKALRLRAERISEDGLRTEILTGFVKVGRMLDETLDYLRDDARSEPVSLIDPPSFLQTICSEFADVGHAAREQQRFRPRASIAQEIMRRHGGSIDMRPAVPTGLRVIMVLPSA
jgi:hypothetical protein